MNRLLKIFIFALPVLLLSFASDAALSVTGDDVTEAVRNAFVEEGIDENMDIEFFGGTTSFVLPKDSPFKIMVSNLKYDEGSNKFTCVVDVFAEGTLVGNSTLIGKYYLLDGVWVPARSINKGEIIKEKDLKQIMVRRNRIKDANITHKEKLLDKEAKRMLKTGKLILNSEVGDKLLIRKGDMVSAVYQTNKMEITTRALALEDGSVNDRIELQNPKSKKSLFGVVVDADTVRVEIQ